MFAGSTVALVTPMSGDMTADPCASFVTAWVLKGLTP